MGMQTKKVKEKTFMNKGRGTGLITFLQTSGRATQEGLNRHWEKVCIQWGQNRKGNARKGGGGKTILGR